MRPCRPCPFWGALGGQSPGRGGEVAAEVAGSGPRLPAIPGSPGHPDRGVLPALRPLSNTACPLPRTAQLRGQGRAWATLSVPSTCQQAEPPNSAPSHQPQAPPPPAGAAVQAILSRHFCPHHLCRSVGICPVTWQGAHAHRQHWDCSHLGHSGLPSLPCCPLPSYPPCRLSPKGHQEPRSRATRRVGLPRSLSPRGCGLSSSTRLTTQTLGRSSLPSWDLPAV